MDNIGIYIHIPFCEAKCPYCDFYSVNDINEYDTYTNRLINRISELGNKYKRVVDTVYFGGGTPSVLGNERLANILLAVKSSFDVSDNSEITVEVNPNSALKLDFNMLKLAGFNRLSIGMQSANDNELKALGRLHNVDDVSKTIECARKAGFDNISLDLMLCIPYQTKDSLSKSIKFCKEKNVEHISAYILKIEQGTRFYDIKDTLPLFDDDKQADIYKFAVSELEKYGYKQYEISNFSKPGFEGKHNLKYWNDEEYLGIGPSAHSFADKKRFYYGRSISDFYSDTIINDGSGGNIEEYIMLALRLKSGLDLDKLSDRYNSFYVTDKLARCINTLSAAGLVVYEKNIISLTTEGFLVSNSIINYIIDSI